MHELAFERLHHAPPRRAARAGRALGAGGRRRSDLAFRGALVCAMGAASAMGAACSGGASEDTNREDETCVALGSTLGAGSVAAPPTALTLAPTGGGFDYQLGCAYPVPERVSVVTRDRTSAAEPDIYSVCYVNAFQTQPGRDETGPLEALILRDSRGRKMVDPDWPDEYLLDISSPERREQLTEIVAGWIAQCAADGYDAIELDNLDSYSRSDQRLTVADAEAYAVALLGVAHDQLLSVAQKNAPERSAQFHALGFDFVIAEECWRYDECERYTEEYGALVFDVEYEASDFERACRAARSPVPILRDLALVSPGPGYVRRTCP